MSVWENVARYCQEVYGAYIDWDEGFFECPECGEPIYEEDYNQESDYYRNGEMICPICEIVLDAEE